MSNELVRLNHPELLLLDLAEEYSACVKGVAADGDSWGTANKRRYDGYGEQVWAEALESLLAMGLVEFWEQQQDIELGKQLRPTRDEILKELARTDISFDAMDEGVPERPILIYRLTPAGGAVWEQFARVEWNRYIDWCFEFQEDGGNQPIGFAKCTKRDHLERFLAMARRAGVGIAFETVTWREEKNWKVRRWKTLPNVHVAEFTVNGNGAPNEGPMRVTMYAFLAAWKRVF